MKGREKGRHRMGLGTRIRSRSYKKRRKEKAITLKVKHREWSGGRVGQKKKTY